MMKYFWTLLLVLLMSALAFADTKKIEGTTNVEDAILHGTATDNNYGGHTDIIISPILSVVIRVKNVSDEIPAGATISACVCSVYNHTGGISMIVGAYRIFKPWVEGDEVGIDDDDGDVTWNDWASDEYEWTTAGCNSADDEGEDNSGDGTGADRKATAFDTEDINNISVWFVFEIPAELAQAWYDGTANENGFLLKYISGNTANHSIYATESGTNPPFFVFTYTTEEVEAAPQMIMINP